MTELSETVRRFDNSKEPGESGWMTTVTRGDMLDEMLTYLNSNDSIDPARGYAVLVGTHGPEDARTVVTILRPVYNNNMDVVMRHEDISFYFAGEPEPIKHNNRMEVN
jgi:hypothetical protein